MHLFELTKQTLNIMQPILSFSWHAVSFMKPIPTTKNIKKYICRCVTSAVGAAPACLYSYNSHFRGGALGVGCTSSCSKRWRKSFTAMVLYKVLLMGQKSGKLTSWGKGSLSHYLQGFIHSRWLALGFRTSTVPCSRMFHTHASDTGGKGGGGQTAA